MGLTLIVLAMLLRRGTLNVVCTLFSMYLAKKSKSHFDDRSNVVKLTT